MDTNACSPGEVGFNTHIRHNQTTPAANAFAGRKFPHGVQAWIGRRRIGLPPREGQRVRPNYFTVDSGVMAGPFSTVPSGAKCDPWQGQSQQRSNAFQCTWQPRCVQAAERVINRPLVSR